MILSAAVLTTGLVATGHARAASCEQATADLVYGQQNATAKFTVHPACAGTATQVGGTTVHLDARRCGPFSCSSRPRQTLTCRWSKKGCAFTITWPHPATERASYQFDMDYSNDDKHPVVYAGAETVATSCVAAAVTYDCAV